MASNSEWLARKLLELEQQVQALGRGTRLGHSSLQGESILALDEDGEVLAELGTDGGAGGVVHLDGPEPPRPTTPVLEQGVGTIFVRWDGAWDPIDEGDEGEPPTTPIDFDRIEVHATTDPEATEWDEDTLAGSITQRNGGVVMIRGWDIDDVVYVRLVCRSLADKVSEPSEPAEVTVTGIDIAAIVEELDAANVELSNLDGTMFAVGAELDALAITFKNLDTSIINTDDGTLAEALADARQALEDLDTRQTQLSDTVTGLDETTLPALRQDLDAAEGRLGEAEQDITDAFGQIDAVPGQISDAQQAAIDAAALDAGIKADAARDAAIAEAEVKDQQVRSDIDDVIGGAVSDLEGEIATVRTSVDGKNAITQSVDAPPTQYDGAVGDRWERMSGMGSGGSLVSNWRWNGYVWVSTLISDAVLGNVDAAKIGTGYLDAARIRAGSIYADRIVSGLSQNMVPDPGFVNDEINAYRVANAGLYGSEMSIADGVLTVDASAGLRGAANMPLASTADVYAWASFPAMRVVARINARMASGSGGFRYSIRIRMRDGSTAFNAMDPTGYRPLSAEWAEYSSTYTLPQDAIGYSVTLQFDSSSVGVIELRSPFAASSIGTTVIEDGAVTTGKLRADVLEVGNLKAGAGEIAELVSRKIAAATGQFLELDVGQLTVTGQSKLADVVAEQIAADTARFMELEADSITAREIAANAIGARAIAADAVEAGKIAADSISGREIIANSIKAEHIVAFTITAGELAANSVSTDKLVANSVIADKIAANAITAGKIEALAVTADKLAANAVTADKIAANAITSGKIDSDAINGMVITGATVRTSATGQRVEMNADGLVQYNAQGQPIVDMTGGTFSTVGSLQTGRPGDRKSVV